MLRRLAVLANQSSTFHFFTTLLYDAEKKFQWVLFAHWIFEVILGFALQMHSFTKHWIFIILCKDYRCCYKMLYKYYRYKYSTSTTVFIWIDCQMWKHWKNSDLNHRILKLFEKQLLTRSVYGTLRCWSFLKQFSSVAIIWSCHSWVTYQSCY